MYRGGGPESGRKKFEKNAFRPVPVQKFTFPDHKIGAAISGPRIADTSFTDTKRIFLIGPLYHSLRSSALSEVLLSFQRLLEKASVSQEP